MENSNERIPIIANDEVGELSMKFNLMVDLLNDNMETIKESSIQKQWLLDNLTHEMRTPLTSIQGFSEYLMRANASEEDKLVALTHINEETNRLKELINKMFDLMTLKKESLNIEKLNPGEIFDTIRKIEFEKLKTKNIELKIMIKIEYFYADEHLILVVLTNLIDNAINASKGNSNRSAIYRGAGLGLSLSKKIIDLHDGDIEIKSQKNTGTEIYISLKTI